jgi:long-chain fatty acid transport protein
MKSLRFCAAGATALALSGTWAERAEAAGFASQQFGGEQGSVVATNPTALYYNPGALGFSPGTALGMYGSLAIRHATWTPASNAPGTIADPADAQGANSAEAKLLNVFGGASAAGTTHIGNLVIGAGFFAPFYGISHWEKNDTLSSTTVTKYPYAVDGSQRWFSIDGKMEVLYFTAGAAYRLGPLSIGATANVISSTVSVNQAKGNQGLADTSQEGRAYLDAHGFDGSFAAGAMLEILRDQIYLAGSYQAQPGLGQQSLNGMSSNTQYGKTQDFPVTFTQSLPDIFRAGLRVRPKGIPWEFRIFGDYTRWSKMQYQCVVVKGDPCTIVPVDGSTNPNQGAQPPTGPDGVQTYDRRNWNNTWGARIGASYWAKPQIELFVGGGYETAAVPDSTLAPDLFDANNILMAIGGRFALTDTLFFTASYTQIQYMNRDNTGKSTLNTFPNTVQINIPTVEEDGGGKYTQWIGIVTGNVEAMF